MLTAYILDLVPRTLIPRQVPLHNACSYGHYEVAEMLIAHGASVNASDFWRFTPLHEASFKSRARVCRLLLRHGADPTLYAARVLFH